MPIKERIIEEEQSIEPDYGVTYDYSLEDSDEFSASGIGEGSGSAVLEFVVKTLEFSASGIGEGSGLSDLTFSVLSLKSSGFSDTKTFANLLSSADFFASGSGKLTSEAFLISNLYSLESSGEGIGSGHGSLVDFIYLNASSSNDSNGEALLSFPLKLTSSGEGEGTGTAKQFVYITALVADALGIGGGTSDITVETKTQEELDKREESFFIGDVEIPLLVSKDVSVERETAVKEFVRDDPQFFQESSDFESGSYSAFLNQENHSENKTLEEQIQDVRKLIERQPEQNEINYASGKAHAVVNSVGDVIDVDEEIKEVDLEIIILENL